MLRPAWSTTPAKPSRVRALLEVSATLEGAADSGALELGGGRVPDAGGSVIIVLEVPDTKLVGILALPEDERRLYVCVGGCLGLSERGR